MLKTFQAFKQYSGTGRNTHMLTDEEIKETQTILLEIMDDFDALCQKNGLTYFLTGGSALGAVRNSGFIPWDDDIDVIMPRKDYDRLPHIVAQECGDKYWVQSLQTSEAFDLCFAKFRKKRTKYVELFESEPDKAGFFLDVFPLEDTYNNSVLRFLNGIVDETLFLIASCVRIHQQKERLIQFFKETALNKTIRIKAAIGSLFDHHQDRRIWYKRCERWQSKLSNPDSHYVTVSCGRGHYFGEMYIRKRLYPLKKYPFEGREWYVPGDCGYLLTKLYGSDYLKPSDPDQIERHVIIQWDPSENNIQREGERQ